MEGCPYERWGSRGVHTSPWHSIRPCRGGVKWLEECLMPDDYKGYAELRAKVGHLVMITCGEHEYTRYGFRQLLEQGCVDLLQPTQAGKAAVGCATG